MTVTAQARDNERVFDQLRVLRQQLAQRQMNVGVLCHDQQRLHAAYMRFFRACDNIDLQLYSPLLPLPRTTILVHHIGQLSNAIDYVSGDNVRINRWLTTMRGVDAIPNNRIDKRMSYLRSQPLSTEYELFAYWHRLYPLIDNSVRACRIALNNLSHKLDDTYQRAHDHICRDAIFDCKNKLRNVSDVITDIDTTVQTIERVDCTAIRQTINTINVQLRR